MPGTKCEYSILWIDPIDLKIIPVDKIVYNFKEIKAL